MDVATWLRQLGLERYEPLFRQNELDWDVLPELTDADLEKLGLPLGPRKKLLKAIAALSTESVTPSEPAAPPEMPDREAERRQLTVLFCDLAGSTELSQQLDPEELREVMGRYHDAVVRSVTAREGHVAKLLGDGVLAYFGWPHAHEDAPERAVRAALDAVALVRSIETAGGPLAARAGIATGPVVVGDAAGEIASERGSVTGATPNLAARLEALAAPGQVVISEATRLLLGSAFELEDGGKQALKGFAEPVAVWRVGSPARTASRFDALHGASLTDFVGRDHELGLLRDRWCQARGGEGQVVLISGEAGIGKSRIVHELAAGFSAEDCRILRYQCAPHETNTAFHPIVSEIEATAGIDPADPAETQLDRLESHLAAVFGAQADAAPVIAGLLGLPLERYPPLDLAPQRRKQRTIALLAERVALLARAQPLVLLVEDVHWIDASSLETLDALVERTHELPVLLVVTHRPEFTPHWAGHGHITMHSLNRLGRSQGQAIAERVAGGKALPAELLDRIVAQTDGIPLFVEELTKAVLEAGLLQERDDEYVLAGPLPALSIPATLQDSLMARLDRLASVKRVIQAAACIGREFDAGLLSAALEIPTGELDAALAQLGAAQLVFRRGGAEGRRYLFKHALVQDAAYASLLSSTRRRLHARLAAALEAMEDPDPLALARHHLEAGANARAAALYLDAGRRLLAGSAVPEAIGAFERGFEAMGALAAGPGRDRLELDLRTSLGAARMARFGWAHPALAEALEPAFALARRLDDRDALGSILWGLWVHYQTRTDFPRAHAWLAELAAVAAENPNSDLPVIYDVSNGCQHFWEADYGAAIGHTDHLKTIYAPDRAARLVALMNHDPLVFAQHWAGSLAEWVRGYPGCSVERMDEAVALARRIGHPFNLVFALTAGASSLIYLDDAERLLAHCEEAERVAENEALGPFAAEVLVGQWRGGAHIRRGRFETGLALARAGNEFWNESGGRICNAMFRSWLVSGLHGLGRIDEALELNAGTIAHCRETGDRFMEAECVRMRGELMLARRPAGRKAAERLFREALAIAEAHKARSWELRAATSLARLWAEQGRHDQAHDLLAPVYGWFTEGFGTVDLEEARSLLEEVN